jgi:murein DD-endopeptidase MepM/ murein hydrolase activator NlpD
MKRLHKIFSKKFTLMIAPGASGVTRQWRVSKGTLYILGTAVAVVGLANLFFGASYLEKKISEDEYNRLRTENAELTQRYERMRWELSDMSERYDDLVNKEIAIRQMFDLPEIDPEQRLLGVGGPEAGAPEIDSRVDELAYQSAVELDRLNRLARFEVDKFDEVLEGLSEKKRKLDHMPTIMPTEGWLSRGFGMKPNPFTGTSQMHRGLDLANHRGTKVIATGDGKIKSARRNGGMGKMVEINHGFGYVTRYGHLDKIMVKPGQKVKRGDVIGLMGSTGYSTGPHLHYEVVKNGKSQNPFNHIIKFNY